MWIVRNPRAMIVQKKSARSFFQNNVSAKPCVAKYIIAPKSIVLVAFFVFV